MKLEIICFLIFLVMGLYVYDNVNDTDWWTNVFCIEQHGLLKENIGFDICYIDQEPYQAMFESNRWTLEKQLRDEVHYPVVKVNLCKMVEGGGFGISKCVDGGVYKIENKGYNKIDVQIDWAIDEFRNPGEQRT